MIFSFALLIFFVTKFGVLYIYIYILMFDVNRAINSISVEQYRAIKMHDVITNGLSFVFLTIKRMMKCLLCIN